MMGLIKPKIEVVEANDTYGKFVAQPLEPGFGVTMGNSLRRVLLSSLPGAAVTWVRIEGVQHEYSSVPHVKEDMIEVLLNVKSVRLRAKSDRPALLKLEVTGEGRVTAADIQPSPDYEIVNLELPLVTMDSSEARFVAELYVERGRGYIPAAPRDGMPIGTLPVDALFSPVRRVNYAVDRTRVEQRTDYDRLTLEVWTDGALTPVEAVQQAAQILVDQFFPFTAVGKFEEVGEEKPPLATTLPAEQYNMPIEKLNLSARTLNCLKRSNINKVGEVLERTAEELLTIRNFGEKSLVELYAKLHSMGLLPAEALQAISEVEKEKAAAAKKEATRLGSLADLRALAVKEKNEEEEGDKAE